MLENYITIFNEPESLIIQKKSKFICRVKSVETEGEALDYINNIRKKYYDAKHHCSAYIIGTKQVTERYNDDGEPAGTAGKPMLEVLRGKGLKNVVAVVTRYFGGTLLGTGGLIKAYTDSVKSSLEQAEILEKKLCERIIINTDYASLPKIEYEVRQQNQRIYDITYSEQVRIVILTERISSESIKKALINITNGKSNIISEGLFYVYEKGTQIYLENLQNKLNDKKTKSNY